MGYMGTLCNILIFLKPKTTLKQKISLKKGERLFVQNIYKYLIANKENIFKTLSLIRRKEYRLGSFSVTSLLEVGLQHC